MQALSYSERAELEAEATRVLDRHLAEMEELRQLVPDSSHPAYEDAVGYLVHNFSSQYKGGRRTGFIMSTQLRSGLETHLRNRAARRFIEAEAAGRTHHRFHKGKTREGQQIRRRSGRR